MKYKYNGEWIDVNIKALDSMPVGTQVEYTGEDIPTGWEEVNDYSTTEIDTGKKWIDGKKIYRKVFVGTTGSGGNWSSFPLNITNLNEITDMRFKCGTSYEMYTSNFYASSTYQIIFRLGESNVQYLIGSGYSDLPYKVIIEYTKTID